MLKRIVLFTFLSLLFVLPATDLAARDQSSYARYLGLRLRLYKESYKILDDVIDKGGDADKVALAKQYWAQVRKAEADLKYRDDGDDDARLAGYKEAIDKFGDPATYAGAASKGQLQLDVAKSLVRIDPEEARKLANDALAMLSKKREELLELQAQGGQAFQDAYQHFSKIGYLRPYSHYVLALTWPENSAERTKECENALAMIDDFQFDLESPTVELVESYMLQGDIELAQNNPEGALGKFLDVVSFMSDSPSSAFSGRIALNMGYLRAAELLTGVLDYDAKYLKQCVQLYSEASKRYGSVRELDFQFKKFQLYRISALIKLGDESQVKSAIDLLFKLATDRERSFQREALSVLAAVAMRDSLDIDLRFRCTTEVFKNWRNNSTLVNLQLVYASQSVLANLQDTKTFESYGPACFYRMMVIYEGLGRFLDAALVARDACYRTIYFQDKFDSEATSLPDHVKGRCSQISNPKDLNEFPAKMAEAFAKYANWLRGSSYGYGDEGIWKELSEDADELKALLGGERAQWDKAYKDANKRYSNDKAYPQAAVRYLSINSRFNKYAMCLYQGAYSYYNIAYNKRAVARINTRGEEGEIESDDWLRDQLARHVDDLAGLPESMTNVGQDDHFKVILDDKTEGHIANWHKAVYYSKKYMLFEVKSEWDSLQARLEGTENPTYLDAFFALAELKNEAWLKIPKAKREPDPIMKRMAYAAYNLAYMLRNPATEDAALKDSLKDKYRDEALVLLRKFWDSFGDHLAGSEIYKKYSLTLAFYAMSEIGDGEGAEEVYRAYSEAFPEDEKEINRMVRNIYSIYREQLTPQTVALRTTAANLRSRFNQMKKGAFLNVSKGAHPKQAEAYAKVKGDLNRHKFLAQYFWDEWIVASIFEREGVKGVLSDEYQTRLKKSWDEMAISAPKRWGDAVKAEFDKLSKEDQYKAVASDVKSAVKGKAATEILSALRAAADKQSDGDKKNKLSALVTSIELNTNQLRYFVGTIFIYEFGAVLESLASDLDQTSRPLSTKVLTFYELYEISKSGTANTLPDSTALLLGKQYYKIQDWERVIAYLDPWLAKNGTERQYGKVTSIPVDTSKKQVGQKSNAQELELKHMLGRAYYERYLSGGNTDDLKKAALLIRRCHLFNLIRDANEVGKSSRGYVFTLTFQTEIEEYYLANVEILAKIYMELNRLGNVKIDWPKYQNQYTVSLKPDPKKKLVASPNTKADYMWFARELHMSVWISYQQLDAYQYRNEYRENLIRWLELSIKWFKENGKKDMGIEELKGDGVAKRAYGVIYTATSQSDVREAYLDEGTKAYKDRLKELLKEAKAVFKKAGIEPKE